MKRITLSIPWPLTPSETREVLSYGFQIALTMYLGLYFLETIVPGFVSLYYSLDILLWIAIGMGVLSGLWPALVVAPRRQKKKVSWQDWAWIGVVSLGSAVVMYNKTESFGTLAKFIALLCGLIVLGLALLVYFDQDQASMSAGQT